MKWSIVGAGSSYTPELLDGLLRPDQPHPVESVVLWDVDADRLAVVSAFLERMRAARSGRFQIRAAESLEDAVAGADYIVAQIRVGGMRARIEDELLGRRHGLLGQETTGVGGFACALRTIPAMLDVARAAERLAPNALLINFANPAGIVTHAMLTHTNIPCIGLCNIPIGFEHDLSRAFECEAGDVQLAYAGLNHLAWIRQVTVRGEDVMPRAIEHATEHAEEEWEDARVREVMLGRMRGMHALLNPYLQYYYAQEETLAVQAAAPATRGQDVLQLERELFEIYRNPTACEKPGQLSKRGGAHYSTAALRIIETIESGDDAPRIVCCRNGRALPELPEDATLELPARLSRQGAEALPGASVPEGALPLLAQVQGFESMTVEAAVTGRYDTALRAIEGHPLLPKDAAARVLLDDVLDTNRDFLDKRFFAAREGEP